MDYIYRWQADISYVVRDLAARGYQTNVCGGVMPPHKLPRSLFKIALCQVEALVNTSCKNIETTYGTYNENGCQEQIAMLQGYLLSNIPGMVLDEVCEERKIGIKQDFRIRLAVYMHPTMRKFSVSNRPVDIKFDFDDSFWIEHLSKLHHLIVLDLHLVCTDEILEVIGNNCSKLEQINIVSKIEPVHTMKDTQETFNALKLKFFVSDAGLYHLCKCKLLKKVTMNKILRSQYGGRMMTLAGIRNLVKSLPYLQNITYDDMGLVISEEMEDIDRLSLTHLNDYHPNPTHIAAAAQLCYNLQHLCLQFPNQTSICSALDILECLACSELQVSILELIQFPFGIEMVRLLENKGMFLRSLLVHTTDYFNSRIMHIIAQSCPNLKNLHLKQLLGDKDNSSSIELCTPNRVEHMFQNLHCLYLGGRDWNPVELLPLCLLHARQLETLTLMQMHFQGSLDDVFAHITSMNPLKELKAVHMFTGRVITITTIQYFFKHCPELSFLQTSNITAQDVKNLHDEVYKNNLDLKNLFNEY
ncbi:hypothetical protein L9F63_020271 [Diploptera punctata]|uniref:Uncharacterized protein n=1 Tax=Diploptera punctata TaxID=6984 RepID=A0AAD7ZSH2_DIPPU|nr:hypothetical protein L9F63_020271 [Diploptera punctata]